VQEAKLYPKMKADSVYPDRPFLCAPNMFNSLEVDQRREPMDKNRIEG
jgi:hypothetical protein